MAAAGLRAVGGHLLAAAWLIAAAGPAFAASAAAPPAAVAAKPATVAATPAAVPARAADAARPGPTDRPDAGGGRYDDDTPPPTAYDALQQRPGVALAPESLGLFRQVGRTLVALAATLALVYVFFKLLMPRLVARLGNPQQRTLSVRERIALDSKNSVVVLEHQDGRQWLLGCGEAGVRVVAADPAPGAAPLPRPRGAGQDFAATLDAATPPT